MFVCGEKMETRRFSTDVGIGHAENTLSNVMRFWKLARIDLFFVYCHSKM